MKVLAIAFALLLVAIGCAHSAPVTFDLTLPLYNSQPGTCTPAVGDTCKDLSQLYVYMRKQGAADSTLMLTANVAGMHGLPYSFTVSQPEGTYLWFVYPADATGNRPPCSSNIVTNTVVLSPSQVSGFSKR